MTLQCDKINLKKGSKGDTVKELQTLLQKLSYYNGKIDGDYGDITVQAVKAYQKKNNLLQDGIFGPITCKKINGNNTTNTNTSSNTYSYYKNGIYHSGQHWTGTG